MAFFYFITFYTTDDFLVLNVRLLKDIIIET